MPLTRVIFVTYNIGIYIYIYIYKVTYIHSFFVILNCNVFYALHAKNFEIWKNILWNWWVDCFIARSTEWCDILGVHSVLNILMYSIKHMHFVKLKKFGFSRTFLLKVIRRLFWVQSSEKQEKVTWIHFAFYPVFFFLSRRLGFLRSPLFLLITESISLDILINLVRGNIIVNANFFSVLKFEYYWNTATSKL